MDFMPPAASASRTKTSLRRRMQRERPPRRYKGVRMRAWGKWVSEIRVPKSGKRIWLGSYDVPEKAARAYDAAQYCLRGELARFNFPAERRPEVPEGSMFSMSSQEIQAIAMNFASPDPSESSSGTTQVSANAMALTEQPGSGVAGNVSEADGGSYSSASATDLEDLQLDDFLMLDIGWIHIS